MNDGCQLQLVPVNSSFTNVCLIAVGDIGIENSGFSNSEELEQLWEKNPIITEESIFLSNYGFHIVCVCVRARVRKHEYAYLCFCLCM